MRKLTIVISMACISVLSSAQEGDGGNISGNVESIFQYLNEDTIIGANQPAEKGLLNSYMNVFYTHGKFKAGIRLESYLPRIQGYPNNYDGTGIGMRYVGYANDFVDITMGSFYEQFGTGLSLRAYEAQSLGYDNQLDGARLILRPKKGITLKGVYGLQRYQFIEGRIVHGPGIVRGADGEIDLNTAIKALSEKKLGITIGASFVSKYQKDDNDTLVLPENVGAYGGRIKFRYGKFTLEGEYVRKENDPSNDQFTSLGRLNYNTGHAAVINFGYSKKGLGLMLSAKSVDNMSYRSDREQIQSNLLINFLPAMNKVHTYNLVASLYPWATQPLGEIAYQGELVYTIKRGSKLGGKYGTTINANASAAFAPNRNTDNVNLNDSSGIVYSTGLFDMSDSLYWLDLNVNIYRKFSKKFNLRLSYFNISMNNDVNKVAAFAHGIINTNIGVAEVGYTINKNHSLRLELQGLVINKVKEHFTKIEGSDTLLVEEEVWNDKGNWATVLIEYNVSPHWFFSIMDQYNLKGKTESVYSRSGEETGVHYIYASMGYIKEATRITLGYGRQRAGLFCVGGICRTVPASNGLTLSFTHSF